MRNENSGWKFGIYFMGVSGNLVHPVGEADSAAGPSLMSLSPDKVDKMLHLVNWQRPLVETRQVVYRHSCTPT